MATVYYRKRGGNRAPTWMVRWREDGKRPERCFPTEEAALEFAANLPEPLRRRGVRGGVARSADMIKSRIQELTREGDGGCWEWTGEFTNSGYGRLTWARPGLPTEAGAHRVSYVVHRGEIPAGLFIDHLCRNRACVNPDHLEPVTGRENVMRSPISMAAINAAKTHCPQGHPYSAENTYVWRLKTQSATVRACKTCSREHARKYQQRKREAARAEAVAS